MKVIGKMEMRMDKESFILVMEINMKVYWKMVNYMEKVSSNIKKEINIMVII